MKERVQEILNELETQSTLEKTRKIDVMPVDRMLAITKETGEMLNILLRLNNTKNMLEIGTSVGYSTIWCADAISDNAGKIITIEQNSKKTKRARENFQKAGIANTVTIREGQALEILKELNKQEKYQNYFDFVLIDADKENIKEYFDLIFPMVTIKGVIITDNMLYPEKYRTKMKKFSENLKTNLNLVTITSPIGNGEEITIKIR